MSKLKVPSLQHLARNWKKNPDHISRLLVALVKNSPTFNYNPLYGAIRDMLVFAHPYEQIEEGLRRGIKRADVRANLLSVLPLIRDHFEDVAPDYVQAVDRRYYSVGRGLMVPFEPPLVYGVGGQIYFPWFSFWRSNPLSDERLSLFVTLVDELLRQDPDLEMVNFEILDFSAPDSKSERQLRVIAAADIPKLDERRKSEMLAIFAEGYFQALSVLSKGPAPEAEKEDQEAREISDQPRLFD